MIKEQLSNSSKSYSLCLMEKVKLVYGSRDLNQDSMNPNLMKWKQSNNKIRGGRLIFKENFSKI